MVHLIGKAKFSYLNVSDKVNLARIAASIDEMLEVNDKNLEKLILDMADLFGNQDD